MLNHVLKTDGDVLFKELLTNKILSKQILFSIILSYIID